MHGCAILQLPNGLTMEAIVMFKIEVKYARNGVYAWRKAKCVGPFLLEESAYAYARKYLLNGWYRIVQIEGM